MPLATHLPTPATLGRSNTPRLAVSVMVDDPVAKAAAAAKVKAAADAKKKAAAAKKEKGGDAEEDPVAKAAAEKKAAEEEAAKKAAEEEKKRKAAALACFADPSLVLTPRLGAPPASVNERADSLRAKGIPDPAIKAALKELGQEEIPYA